MRINGLGVRARDLVVGGESATVEARLPAETGVAAEKLPLDIVHQDAAGHRDQQAAGPGGAPGRRQSCAHAAERAAGARREAQARAARGPRASHRQGHQRVVSRGAHARGAHGAGGGARRARNRARVPRGVHRRDDRRWHRGRTHRPASHATHEDDGAQRRTRGGDALPHREALSRAHARARAARDRAHAPDPRASRACGYPIVGDPVYGGRRRLAGRARRPR